MNLRETLSGYPVKLATIGLIATSLLACSPAATSTPKEAKPLINLPTATATTLPSPTPTMEVVPQIDFNNLRAYPEIMNFPFTAKRFETKHSDVTIFNFDQNLNINHDAFLQVFSFFEDLAHSNQKVRYTLKNGKNIEFSLNPQTTENVGIVIIPENAPNPKWLGSDHYISDTNYMPDLNLTIIRNDQKAYNALGLKGGINDAIAVGISQSSIFVDSLDLDGKLIGQELISTSLGLAYSTDPESYKKLANKLKLLEILPQAFNHKPVTQELASVR